MSAKRTAGGLRETLFSILDGLLDGSVTEGTATAAAKVAGVIISSVNTQIEFERLRLTSEVPATLPAMALIPRADSSGELSDDRNKN